MKPDRINRGQYMYGNTFFDPPIPYYNGAKRHQPPAPCTPPVRPSNGSFDDGGIYNEYLDQAEALRRHSLMYNLVNIETELIHSLKVTLYGVTSALDQTIILEIGKRYAISYLSDAGYQTVVGTLKIIDPSIPTTAVKYIGNYNAVSSQCYIGLDCSVIGTSDKKKIYIGSIRYIEELEDGEEYVPVEDPNAPMTDSEKLDRILNQIDEGLCHVGEVIDTIEDPPISDTGSSGTEDQSCCEKIQNKLDDIQDGMFFGIELDTGNTVSK